MKPADKHFCAGCERLIPSQHTYCVTCQNRLDKQEKELHERLANTDKRCGPCLRIPQARKCVTCPDLEANQTGWKVPIEAIDATAPYNEGHHYQDLLARGLIRDREHFNRLFHVEPAVAKANVLKWIAANSRK